MRQAEHFSRIDNEMLNVKEKAEICKRIGLYGMII
jgi:hypothetical protein